MQDTSAWHLEIPWQRSLAPSRDNTDTPSSLASSVPSGDSADTPSSLVSNVPSGDSADTTSSLASNVPSFVMPQPETEDEKKRFEEGKGRYLQMKAKRQGHTEPQP